MWYLISGDEILSINPFHLRRISPKSQTSTSYCLSTSSIKAIDPFFHSNSVHLHRLLAFSHRLWHFSFYSSAAFLMTKIKFCSFSLSLLSENCLDFDLQQPPSHLIPLAIAMMIQIILTKCLPFLLSSFRFEAHAHAVYFNAFTELAYTAFVWVSEIVQSLRLCYLSFNHH